MPATPGFGLVSAGIYNPASTPPRYHSVLHQWLLRPPPRYPVLNVITLQLAAPLPPARLLLRDPNCEVKLRSILSAWSAELPRALAEWGESEEELSKVG